MLFKRRHLEGIADGSIDLAFRRWDRPRARAGGRQRTALGVIAIDSVAVVERKEISEEDARRSGHGSLDELFRELDGRPAGDIHRIELHWAGEDPRVALRAQAALSDEELDELRKRLERMDAASRHGPWTRPTLELIRDNPTTRAADLAVGIGRETQPFKRDVRKLKELGLTESLERGYRLSPRGAALLDRLS